MLSTASISSIDRSRVRRRWSTTAGSTSPERVPITRPSSGVRPIEVSTLRPLATARRWRRCRGAGRSRSTSSTRGRAAARPRARRTRARCRGSRSGARLHARGTRVGVGVRRQRRVERRVEDRDLRHVGQRARGRPRCRRGWPGCAAARAGQLADRGETASSISTGAENRSPPCTTRWPTAATAVQRRLGQHVRQRRRVVGRPSGPCPTAERRARTSASTTDHFSDDEPQLTTKTLTDRLDRRDRDGVDDVVHGRAAGQVVDRLAQALQHRADRRSRPPSAAPPCTCCCRC